MHADDEGAIYVQGSFDHVEGCGGDPLSWHFSMGNYLYAKFGSWGFDRRIYEYDVEVEFIDLADSSEDPFGADHVSPNGIDTADVGFIYTHGSFRCDPWEHRTRITMGSSWRDNECRLDIGKDSSSNDVDFGDKDLNVLILDTCFSLQKCVWDDGQYYVNGSKLNAILGFHGISYDGQRHYNHFKDYVDSSRYNGVGDNWVDDMTDLLPLANKEECAVAVVFGATSTDRDHIFNNAGLQDWKTRWIRS